MAEREAAIRDGTLIDAKRATATLAHFLVLFRQRVLWIPSRTRARFRDPDLVDFIRNEVHAALEELSELPDAVASGRVTDYQHDPTMPDGNGNGDDAVIADAAKIAAERKRDLANQKRREKYHRRKKT
jgi:hypothetical protein